MTEPVLTAATVQAWLVRLLGGAAVLTGYFGWWNPSGDTILVIAGFGAVIFSCAQEAIGWFVRSKVTPQAHVDAIVTARVAERVAQLADARKRHEATKVPKKAAKATQRRSAA